MPKLKATGGSCALLGLLPLLTGQGCPGPPAVSPSPCGGVGLYNNTTDRTNGGAEYVGANTCMACHPDVAERHVLHGHANILTEILGAPPSFPPEADEAGVPNPPAGQTWLDVSFVLGGYAHQALFIDRHGYLMTNDAEGVDTQWNLAFSKAGIDAGWAPYEADGQYSPQAPKPYGFDCFVCHTTGPLSLEANGGLFQRNEPGFLGTWEEAGVQCEACHGPGSNHLPDPAARSLFVDVEGARCRSCHSYAYAASDGVIPARGGFIEHYAQYSELLASGGHRNLSCLACHKAHAGTRYDRENAICQECRSCHPLQNMAMHTGKLFTRGDYVEEVTCVSCHMPYATRSAASAPVEVVGEAGRMGDLRTHIFRIKAAEADYTAMFTPDGSEVQRDIFGRAEVTVDFVCLRCHSGLGSAFRMGVIAAGTVADGIHE